MRTETISIYQFSELTEKAQRKALDEFEAFMAHIYDEAEKTVNQFCSDFCVKTGSRSWLDYRCNKFDDPINELTGVRLRTWLINNYGRLFTERKCFGEYKKRGEKWNYARRSKVIFQPTCCPLTGVIYDEVILQPLRDFIKKPGNSNLDDLFYDCFETLRNSIDSEIEYRNSDEAKIEDIEANGYEFYENGKRA
jgi:hypothetical protein